MKNIHLLPTQSKTRLFLSDYGKILNLASYPETFYTTGQNIYITSDEEIKEGDWYINTFVSEREQKPQTHTEKRHLINHQKDYRFKYCRKIILTTDPSLAPDVQSIDDEFLEWFVKNPSCERVEVEVIDDNIQWYKIIIPNEEHKGKALSEQEVMDNRSSAYNFIDVDKQETTLEEAAVKWIENKYKEESLSFLDCIEFGAKWQMERSYSDEDLRIAFTEGHDSARMKGSYKSNGTFEEDWILWFEQFKKK
jgi:hypothetical protein